MWLSRAIPADGNVGDTEDGISKVEREMALCQEEIEKVEEEIEEVKGKMKENEEETKAMNAQLLPLEDRMLEMETSGEEIPESLTLQVQSLREDIVQVMLPSWRQTLI